MVECGSDEAGRDINGACMIKKEVNGVDMINSRCEATTPARIAVYSKERLALNTLSDDGMNLQRIFLSRCTIIRQIIKEIV